MNTYTKNLLGTIIIIVFAGLWVAGTGRYIWDVWFNVEKFRKDIKKEFQMKTWQAWLPPAFKRWQLKFVKSKTWLWYNRISISIAVFFGLSMFIIGAIALFQIITGSTCCLIIAN
jgi:hypothetical protein